MNQYDRMFIEAQTNALIKDASYYRDLARIMKRSKRTNLISCLSNVSLLITSITAVFVLPKENPLMFTLFCWIGSVTVSAFYSFSEYMESKFQHDLYLKILLLLYGAKSETKKTNNVSHLKPL